ncbi:MAG: hypothetical protein JNM72_28180 [Deltaproteobacteria bacterium]|nr:hypothetical protein [Deltaproteobacteria bacterium]
MRTQLITFSLVLLAACGGDPPPPPPAPAPAPVAPAPAPEPPPAPAPAPAADGAPMTVDGLNAAREANVGKAVTVKGAYGNVTKQDAPAQINISIHTDDKLEGDAKKLLCIVDVAKEADLAAFAEKGAVVVTGTVAKDDFFGSAKLEGCVVTADPAAPPAEEGGKAGKGKGKGGDEGEGGKAGKGKGKGKGKGE